MSCEENTKCQEKVFEELWDKLKDNYEVECSLMEYCLDDFQIWDICKNGGHLGDYEEAVEQFFSEVWEHDMETMYHDSVKAIKVYLKSNKKAT